MARAHGHSLTSCESIIHHSGPLLRPRLAKYKNLCAQKMCTGNVEPFTEQPSEHHSCTLQTCIPANEENADAVSVRKEMYFKNKQPRTKKE